MLSSMTDKYNVKEMTFRNLTIASDFEIKVVDGIVVEALYTPCSSSDIKSKSRLLYVT